MSVDAHLIHRCDIERAGELRDAYNNMTLVYGPLYHDVPCRFVEKAQRVVQSEKVAHLPVKSLTILFAPGTDVLTSDRISGLVLEDGTTDQRTFRVTQVLTRRARSEHHVSVSVEVIGAPATT